MNKKANEVERLKATIKELQARATEAHKRELYYIDKLAATGRWKPNADKAWENR